MSIYEITIAEKKFIVEVGDVSSSPVKVVVNGEAMTVEFREGVVQAVAASAPTPAPAPEPKPDPKPAAAPATPSSAAAWGKAIVAPMPGKILSVRVKLGDAVTEGDVVCTLEAMKMEMPISSTATGKVQGIHVNVGDSVAYNDPLVTVG